MAPIAIGFGVLLTLLGGGYYSAAFAMREDPTQSVSITVLIPAFFGLALVALGVVARNDKYRVHAMHGAAFLGLIGAIMPIVMVILALGVRGQAFEPFKHGEQLAMAVICAIFVSLCAKSFIDARAARKLKEPRTE